jgi:multidrug efflux system outer membrane protein
MLTDARYRGGVASFLESLDAQRSLYSARRSLASTRLVRVRNLVDFYRAVGGDPTFG